MNGEKIVNNVRFLKLWIGTTVPLALGTQEPTARPAYLKMDLFIFHAYLAL